MRLKTPAAAAAASRHMVSIEGSTGILATTWLTLETDVLCEMSVRIASVCDSCDTTRAGLVCAGTGCLSPACVAPLAHVLRGPGF